MPTGGGKSLCYQVPAMQMSGTCLVISPLIALMKDQVENLRKRGITAYAIYSGMTRKEVINVLTIVSESNCKFLYVSPERLETTLFREYLPGLGISLIAVDEAHCISQWGYDFRPPYLRIAALRDELPGVPVLALTASATRDVQDDICLRLTATGTTPDWKVFRQSFERPNLAYRVIPADSVHFTAANVLLRSTGSGIVYCKSRRRTQEIAELLRSKNIAADFYHAGLTQEERNRKQEAWINNRIRIMVCTNAFGMGIDKPDVRIVVHADVPDCLENYYQEAGRAGRDGLPAAAHLLLTPKAMDDLVESIERRFPPLADIRNVYQCIANYLQLHPGEGMGTYFDFDLGDFIRKFKLDSFTALHSIQALEQDGWVSFNEQVFLPPSLQFTITKDALYQFERENPADDPVLKILLRTYEGIFDYPAPISEKLLAGRLRMDLPVLKQRLLALHQRGVVDYRPQKDSPQLLLLKPRVRTEELRIDMQAARLRKQKYRDRVMKMVEYCSEQITCRSRFIGTYFGDAAMKDCGICDNCIRQNTTPLTRNALATRRAQILALLAAGPMQADELLTRLADINRPDLQQLLDFLQDEQEITCSNTGLVRLR